MNTRVAQVPMAQSQGVDRFPELREMSDDELRRAYQSAKAAEAANPPPAVAQQVGGGIGGEIGRQVGLFARGAINGAVAIPAMAADAIAAPINLGLDAVRGKGNGFRFKPQAQAANDFLTAAGLPMPQNATERVVQNIVSGASGAGSTVAAGGVLSRAANAIASRVGAGLAAGPGLQVVSGATGAGASGVARENGAGTVGQVAAGLAGGLAPALAGPALQATARGMIRGGEVGRQRVAENLATFEAAGTTPTLAQATEGRVARAAESMLAKAPGSSGVIAGRAKEQAAELAAAVQKVSDDLAPGASAVNAGEAISRGVRAFKDGFKTAQRELYKELDTEIPSASRVQADRTRAALAELNEDIAGAPALSKWFKNARIQGIEGGLKSDTTGIEAVLTRPGMREQVDQMRERLTAEASRISALNAERQALGMKNLETVLDEGQIEQRIQDFLKGQVDNRLTYEALKKLRTLVGNEIADGGLAADVPRSKWNALYGALSDDLGDAATAAGPKAEAAWKRANDFTRDHMQKLDELSSVVNRDSPERIFTAAIAGTAEGDTIVKRVMNALPGPERREVVAAVIQRLGRATAGQQNAVGDEFSSETFLTNLSKLSPAARQSLFRQKDVPALEKRINEFARVAESRRDGGRVFANPSGTASSIAQLGGLAAAGGAFATGNFAGLAGAAAVPAGANLMARALSSPVIPRFAAKQTVLKPGADAATVGAAARALDGSVNGEASEPAAPAFDFSGYSDDELRQLYRDAKAREAAEAGQAAQPESAAPAAAMPESPPAAPAEPDAPAAPPQGTGASLGADAQGDLFASESEAAPSFSLAPALASMDAPEEAPIMNRLGKPFTNRFAAMRAQKKAGDDFEVSAADGGFVVRRSPTTPEAEAMVGESLGGEWSAFAGGSGTLGVARAEMPQIKAEHRGAMTNFLGARGIPHEIEEVAAADLKPTQAEFSREKVKQAREFKGGDRSILVSSDGHVLDGHHQWMAKLQSGENVKVIRLDAPIDVLLDEVRAFPSAQLAGDAGQPTKEKTMTPREMFRQRALEKQGVKEGDKLHPKSGRPYTNRFAAVNAAKQIGDGYEPAKVETGYVLRKAGNDPDMAARA